MLADLALGATAGCVATLPMTLTMDALHRRLPAAERYPLPPRPVAMHAVQKAGLAAHLDGAARQRIALAAHFGMGTSMGLVYGAVAKQWPLRGPLGGALFGLGVWASNYLGLLPALGIIKPATEHPPRRTGVMILAHLVWGATTATIVDALVPAKKGSTEAMP